MTADLIALYLAHLAGLGRTEATLSTYGHALRQADRDLPYGLASASADELTAWVFAPGSSMANRHVRRAAVVGLYTWATDEDHPRLDFNPARRLPPVKVPTRASRAPGDPRIAEILRAVPKAYRLLFLLAAFAGLRCIELAALDREHVTQDAVWVQGKGGKQRLVPCHPLIWAAVRDLPPGPLLTGTDGRRLDRRQVSSLGNRVLRQLGHGDLGMHDLRRWFGTSAYEASGRDIRVVQELLGHSSVAVTQRYIATRTASLASAVAALPTCGAER